MNLIRQFVAAVVSLGSEMRVLTQEVAAVSAKLQQQLEALKQGELREVVQRRLDTQRDASRKRQDRVQLAIALATWAAFLAAVVYAFISYQQWRDSNQNFRRDERAWIAFQLEGSDLQLSIGKSFLVPTKLINVGKTPAKNVRGNVAIAVIKEGEKMDFAYTPGHANYFIQAGTMFPNGAYEEAFEAIRHGAAQAEPIILTRPMLDAILSGDAFIVIHGRIVYRDVFGAEHWTTYCRYVTNPARISQECMVYNDTDDDLQRTRK